MAVGVKLQAGNSLAPAWSLGLRFLGEGERAAPSPPVSMGSPPFVTWRLWTPEWSVGRWLGIECGHMSNTKWDLPISGLGCWLGSGEKAKTGGGSRAWGFMRTSASIFFLLLVYPVSISSRSLEHPPAPHFPPFFSCPAPFPSRAGPSRTSPIVSCRASMESWKSRRWLLVLTSGSYKWWLIEKAPKGWSPEQLCWKNGPVQAPAANFQMWGAEAAEDSPQQCGLNLYFLCLLGGTPWLGSDFQIWRWISGQPMSPVK